MQTLELQLKAYQQQLLQNPKDLNAQAQCGNLCVELGRFEEAAGYFRRLVRIFKNNGDLRDALCFALQALGNEAHSQARYALAEACFSEALLYQPNEVAYLYNLANALRELGKPSEAAKQYQKALTLSPNDADIYNNLGNVQRELGLLDFAVANYEKAMALNPKLFHAKVHWIHQKQHMCDWVGLDEAIADVRGWLNTEPSAQISPFAFLAMPGTSMAEQKECASQWIRNRFAGLIEQSAVLNFKYSAPKPKLKVGYLSADFRLHPLAFLMTELIELHNKTQFETFAFSYGPDDKTSTRARLVKAFDHFIDIRDLNDIEAAQKINQLEIDILVDLTGFTQTSRTGIVALRPAAIHVNWLGFAGTMGHLPSGKPLFDYVLTDGFISPAETSQHYAETLVPLPCYQPNDRKRPIGKVPSRAQCHLPEDAFVYCCFNQSFKITPDIFVSWMRILAATPNSVLWLLACNVWAKQNLIDAAIKQGVAAERLIFAPRLAIADHLARHQHADLFLDTLPYNAHTTCSDALWMNVPVLTCTGNTFASRVAGSLMSSVGLPELVADTLDAYEQKAIFYAQHPQQLAALKHTLKQNLVSSPLFNTPQLVLALEEKYQMMIKQHLS